MWNFEVNFHLLIPLPENNTNYHIIFIRKLLYTYFISWRREQQFYFLCPWIGGYIVFVLFVCLLSPLAFAITLELFLKDRHFIFSIHTQLMIPFEMTPRSMNLTVTFMLKIAFSDLVATGGIVFHKHRYFIAFSQVSVDKRFYPMPYTCICTDCTLLGKHTRSEDSAEVLGPEVSAHRGGILPRGHHELSAGHPGRQVLPEDQVAVHDTGRSSGH